MKFPIAIPDNSLPFNWKPSITMHGRSDEDHPNVGARITADTVCTRCKKPFLKGHVITLDLKPHMAGTGHHTDCEDPKLEREESA